MTNRWYYLWDCPKSGKKSCINICKWCEYQTTCPTLPKPNERLGKTCNYECAFKCGDSVKYYRGHINEYEYLFIEEDIL